MKKLRYIQMFSVHGLLRSENLELGRDADTGGQINYILELCRSLSALKSVARVDLLTRWISDKSVSDDYACEEEVVNDKFRIVRIRCGGKKYLRKELLWPHLDEFVDKTIKFIKRQKRVPDVVHGHYPDAGYVAMELARIFGIPFVYTGHSLGRAKKEKLLNEGMKETELNKKLKIDHRIQVEEQVIRYANLVVTSTRQEVTKQYGMYQNNDIPEYAVIPPGLDIEKFYPFYHDILSMNEKDEETLYARASVVKELERFFINPDKPLILTLCRPDKRKNIQGLVKAYGEDLELQTMANLAVFAGIRKDISQKEDSERSVLTEMLLLMDKYDLYGRMAIPKKHDFEHEVPELYRIAAQKKGVFVNPALTEPFGLTLLEAAATGLPIVATNDGGPRDIMDNCRNGILIDPTSTDEISDAIKKIISDTDTWESYSKKGILNVRKHYTWERHSKLYLEKLSNIDPAKTTSKMAPAKPSDAIGRRLAGLDYFIVTDIDNTLIGGPKKQIKELISLLKKYSGKIGFAVATGRTVDSAVSYLTENGVPRPDIVISSVGSEIYYGMALHPGRGWSTHISVKWNREKIVDLLKDFDFLEYQDEVAQRKFKVSYNMSPKKDRLPAIHNRLLKNKCQYQLIYSHGKYLDILPHRASKGKAIRYLSYKWEIPLKNILVCGDSGNDEEMLRGEPLAVVVGNYSSELEKLKGARHVYFAENSYAGGILEGLEKYKFLKKAKGSIL